MGPSIYTVKYNEKSTFSKIKGPFSWSFPDPPRGAPQGVILGTSGGPFGTSGGPLGDHLGPLGDPWGTPGAPQGRSGGPWKSQRCPQDAREATQGHQDLFRVLQGCGRRWPGVARGGRRWPGVAGGRGWPGVAGIFLICFFK